MAELYDDILGPEAAEVFLNSLLRHREHMNPREIEAVEQMDQDPGQLTEAHKLSLNDLLLSVSDDFGTRRRMSDLKKTIARTVAPEEDELEALAGETDEPLPETPGGGVQELVEDLRGSFNETSDDDLDGVDDG